MGAARRAGEEPSTVRLYSETIERAGPRDRLVYLFGSTVQYPR